MFKLLLYPILLTVRDFDMSVQSAAEVKDLERREGKGDKTEKAERKGSTQTQEEGVYTEREVIKWNDTGREKSVNLSRLKKE